MSEGRSDGHEHFEVRRRDRSVVPVEEPGAQETCTQEKDGVVLLTVEPDQRQHADEESDQRRGHFEDGVKCLG